MYTINVDIIEDILENMTEVSKKICFILEYHYDFFNYIFYIHRYPGKSIHLQYDTKKKR